MEDTGSSPHNGRPSPEQDWKGKAKVHETPLCTSPAQPQVEDSACSNFPVTAHTQQLSGGRAQGTGPTSKPPLPRPPSMPRPPSQLTEAQPAPQQEYSAEFPEFSRASPYVDPNNRAPRSPIAASVLHQVLQRMPASPTTLPPGKCIGSFHVNTRKPGVCSEELQKVGMILFMPGITPQLKRVEEWVETDLVQKLGVGSVQVQVMGQSTFLIVMDSADPHSTNDEVQDGACPSI
jgi:hypothetical protein